MSKMAGDYQMYKIEKRLDEIRVDESRVDQNRKDRIGLE